MLRALTKAKSLRKLHRNQYKLENFLQKPPWGGFPRGFLKIEETITPLKICEKATLVSVIFNFNLCVIKLRLKHCVTQQK